MSEIRRRLPQIGGNGSEQGELLFLFLKGEEGRFGPITEAFLLMAQRSAAMLIHCRIPCA
jgi:hypothetical protein